MKLYIKQEIQDKVTRKLHWLYLQPYNAAAQDYTWGDKETAVQLSLEEITQLPKFMQNDRTFQTETCPEGGESGKRVTATEVRGSLGIEQKTRKQGEIIPERQRILQEAISLICGSREESYGSPDDNFATVAKLWNVYIQGRKINRPQGDAEVINILTSKDVAVLNILQKIARQIQSPNDHGNWVDMAGYSGLGGEVNG